jgi:hypothetical protein
VGVLKAQGWRREAGQLTVFPAATHASKFEEYLPELLKRLEGGGRACFPVVVLICLGFYFAFVFDFDNISLSCYRSIRPSKGKLDYGAM